MARSLPIALPTRCVITAAALTQHGLHCPNSCSADTRVCYLVQNAGAVWMDNSNDVSMHGAAFKGCSALVRRHFVPNIASAHNTYTCRCPPVQLGGAVHVQDSSDVLVDGAIFTECAAEVVRRAPAALLPSPQHGLALP